MPTSNHFLTVLKTNLKNRLPRDEFNQVMDESLWEFESENQAMTGERAKQLDPLMRLSSLCVAFYHAMKKVGIDPRTALDSMDKAGDNLDWTPVPQTTSRKCTIADYFRMKQALDVCQVTFCKSCPERGKGCRAAEVGITQPVD